MEINVFCISVYTMIFIGFAGNFICETIQLSLDNGYGYKGILELLELNKNLTSTNINACNTYISNINYKLDFSLITTIFDIVIDIISFLYIFCRFIEYKSCRIGALLTLFLIFGKISAFILTCISSDYFFKTKYKSNDFESCNKMNGKFQISESDFLEKLSSYILLYIFRLVILSFIYFSMFSIKIKIYCDDDFDDFECISEDCKSNYCINKENL